MTKPTENQVNVDDYYDMPLENRTILDDWLKSLGGVPAKTRLITLYKDYIEVEEYRLSVEGKFIYNWKTKDIEVDVRQLPFEVPPPVWK